MSIGPNRELSVSVVVPSKNRPVEIARMLCSLRMQFTAPREVIVIDQSTPCYRLANFANLVHVHAPRLSGLTAARNAGVSRATGDVILFFDDDVLLKSDCVREIARLFAARPDVVGAQCSIQNPWDGQPMSLYDVSTRIFEHGFFDKRPRQRDGETVPRLIDGLASAYRRTIFEHECFDEDLPGYGLAEDWDFTKRAMRYGNLVVATDARVEHVHTSTNRHDPVAYMQMRRANILYLYEKLRAGNDLRNRLWKQWWLLGEELRRLNQQRKGRLLR